MDYQRIYDAFIADRLLKCPEKAKRKSMERHHIVPKCLSGSNDLSNLVNLSFSDHIFAHLLLAKLHGGKLAIAFQRMTTVERYRGRHTRLKHAALMAESRKAKGNSMRGRKQSAAHAEALKRYNESRRGKGLHPNLLAARKRQGELRRGKPAHPKALEAISRKGVERSPAQKERDRNACAAMRGNRKEDASARAGAKRRGQPWTPARRAAQDARQVQL